MPRATKRAVRERRIVPIRPRAAILLDRLLLDTHVWLWWQANDRRLGPRARDVIRDASEVRFSAASAWEIAIKTGLGKLRLPPDADIDGELKRVGFAALPVTVGHAALVRTLPPLHRDPFDRMLVAQALAEGLTLVTADTALQPYGIAVVDADR